MTRTTLPDYLDDLSQSHPDRLWLRDRKGDQLNDWSRSQGQAEINAAAAWLEQRFGANNNIALLSRNRAHWVMADLAVIASGNVSVPMFTTLATPTAEYILTFTDAVALIIGESTNQDAVLSVVPDNTLLITLPGVELSRPHIRWDDIVAEHVGQKASYVGTSTDLVSLVFTSGTTGVPKGVMQDHESLLIPMLRAREFFHLRDDSRFLSYLPLAHIAERQLVLVNSLIYSGSITFNESLPTLLRDMAATRPSYFFGAPRVWEQLQQGILAKFGSQGALDQALAADAGAVGLQVRTALGLDDTDYLCTASAPTPPALIDWYEKLGLNLMEAFGQTELMAVAGNTLEHNKVGSIGFLPAGVEFRVSDEGELLFKAPGAAVGYYKMPAKTAETFVDGWVHTGDKGYMDEDGFIFLTGRVKDYFKTIQGKYVAPVPIENSFAKNQWSEQQCLLGRGYSKTVIVCVLSEIARQQATAAVEHALREHVVAVNQAVDKHARIGAVIITSQAWTADNEMLTPTLKVRRDEIDKRFGEQAQDLAHQAAVEGEIQVQWVDEA